MKYEVSEPLSSLINLSLSKGIFPEKLKIASVIPIYKSGSRVLVHNYRPISNLDQIFEKIVYARLNNFLNRNISIFYQQFGFRHNYSTNHALITITEKVRKALENSMLACGVFVDLQKAFNTVNHDILVHKLNHYGI